MNNKIKLLIWDLDNTVWEGILTEDIKVDISDTVKKTIVELDKRGILQSICSKNDFDIAMEKLREFEIAQYFLYPQINWNSKASNVSKIIEHINISQDTVAFIDDQVFEREEVKYSLPEVRCYAASQLSDICEMPEFMPDFLTDESQKRRELYQADLARKLAEESFEDSQDAFLESLRLEMQIREAEKEDFARLAELMIRTHQLNTTGILYTYEELTSLLHDPAYRIYICSAKDIYGDYGKVGMAVVNIEKDWTIKLFITSCRVMSRGIGKAFLAEIINRGLENNKKIYAEFCPTDRNRIMALTYAKIGFSKKVVIGSCETWRYGKNDLVVHPKYINIKWEETIYD